jgi:hypothetical protein
MARGVERRHRDGEARILFGDVNPSGQLAHTFPASDEQGPAGTALEYPGDGTMPCPLPQSLPVPAGRARCAYLMPEGYRMLAELCRVQFTRDVLARLARDSAVAVGTDYRSGLPAGHGRIWLKLIICAVQARAVTGGVL